MANFLDVTSWEEKRHFQTGGTRSKAVVENPQDDSLYFFKTSISKFKHEFWSEIIASEVGLALGFKVLIYDIAKKGDEIGCLSKLMIDLEYQQLTEGVNYLQGYDARYSPDKKESHDKYTFHFIVDALKEFNLENTIPNLIQTIIFDSIIGNGDRHQENWGYIQSIKETDLRKIKRITQIQKNKFIRRFIKAIIFIRHIRTVLKNKLLLNHLDNLIDSLKGVYSPIYDSGSCLGRELEDDKVNNMLSNPEMLLAYVNKGTSEIRWKGPKLKHNVLIQHILSEYPDAVKSTIALVKELFNEQKLQGIVLNIDKKLPIGLNQHHLPDNRKELIIKMITLRIDILKRIIE